MAIAYPSNLPCPAVQGNQMRGGSTFDVTPFDYGDRYRERHCNTYHLNLTFFLKSRQQMIDFKNFYYTALSKGSKPFEANWEVEGSLQLKEFRFTDRYVAIAKSGGLYQVSARLELITPIKELS